MCDADATRSFPWGTTSGKRGKRLPLLSCCLMYGEGSTSDAAAREAIVVIEHVEPCILDDSIAHPRDRFLHGASPKRYPTAKYNARGRGRDDERTSPIEGPDERLFTASPESYR
jgi:hypothetical protein